MDLNTTALLVGLGLALSVSAFATITGLDRDRAFYPTVTIVIALIYELFAVMGGSARALLAESLVAVVFVGASTLGFQRNLWWVAAALAAHGIFDIVHGGVIANPGVPAWWPAFCLAYDVAAAGYLAALLGIGRLRARPA
jgi:hypothetical protein